MGRVAVGLSVPVAMTRPANRKEATPMINFLLQHQFSETRFSQPQEVLLAANRLPSSCFLHAIGGLLLRTGLLGEHSNF